MSTTDSKFLNFLTELAIAGGKTQGGEMGSEEVHLALCKTCRSACLMLSILSKHTGANHEALAAREHKVLIDCKTKRDAQAQIKTHRGYELGAREFTLTYSPKWMSDEEARIKMNAAVQKIIKYYRDEIVELRAVGEVGSNGLSHVHCFYKLSGGVKITDKNFKRAWSYWNPKKPLQRGFEGGHHATVRNESDFKGYIDKDIDTAWLDVISPMPSDPI